MFREHELSVGDDVEDSLVSLDQLGFDPELAFELCCQTGSVPKITSKDTVSNRYLHTNSPARGIEVRLAVPVYVT